MFSKSEVSTSNGNEYWLNSLISTQTDVTCKNILLRNKYKFVKKTHTHTFETNYKSNER